MDEHQKEHDRETVYGTDRDAVDYAFVARQWAEKGRRLYERRIGTVLLGLSRMERLVIILAIGIAIGYGLKRFATETITIGYQDYMLSETGSTYDLLAMQKRLAETTPETSGMTEETGATCQ